MTGTFSQPSSPESDNESLLYRLVDLAVLSDEGPDAIRQLLPEPQRARFDELLGIHTGVDDLRRRQEIAERSRREYETLSAREAARERLARQRAEAEFAGLSPATLAAELAEGVEPVEYLIKDYVPDGCNVIVNAAKKVGKTTLMNHLARCYADGLPFLGRYATKQLRVGIWNYEVERRQYLNWMADARIENTGDVVVEHLRGKSVNLRSDYVCEVTVQWLKSNAIDVWILDPGHRACAGFDSEKNTEVLEFTEKLDAIRKEAGVRSIHMPLHTGHNGKHARGAVRFGDWADVIWTYEKENDRRALSAEGRDVEMPEQTLSYDPVTRQLAVSGGSLAFEEKKTHIDLIVQWMREHPDEHPARNSIGGHVGIKKESGAYAADEAVRRGLLEYRPGRRKDSRHLHLPGSPFAQPG
ncbi:AAA family ATPase [Streptomyces chitinivorans]|uniref:AAA family ATPase n=1 Tax=Streptomyces chitinivorans TaxID=1257027 RepID=A0ABW7HM92_9ACTN|nr:AAA family ATPase [Streptomyces chitinivorans]MDH2410836.1 AAA family ATPase [Streptomyces chitinivorans]